MAKKGRKASPKFYSKGRVKRGAPPIVTLTKSKYRHALPELRRDFQDRCAYCMRHIGTETEMQVDHFDPRKKQEKRQEYSNLFLADAHCNGAKSDTWPTAEEMSAGCHFLNCCDEFDYDKEIFEDPDTHELVGITPAAIYHIETIDLNDPGLIAERKYRSEVLQKFRDITNGTQFEDGMKTAIEELEVMLNSLIPEIQPPPDSWSEVA